MCQLSFLFSFLFASFQRRCLSVQCGTSSKCFRECTNHGKWSSAVFVVRSVHGSFCARFTLELLSHIHSLQTQRTLSSSPLTKVRGIVTRDRIRTVPGPSPQQQLGNIPPHIFRPVTGTFTAVGDSEDTHDPSYSLRPK
jgi:hypothetical protein